VAGANAGSGAPVEVGSTPSVEELRRRAVRRRQTRRRALVAGGSSVVVLGALAVAVLSSPGWPVVRETFFDWSYGREVLPAIFKGLLLNIRLTVVSTVCIAVIGLALALIRTSRTPALAPLRILAAVYVDVFRGVPTLLVILLVGFGVPALGLTGVTGSVVVLGTLAIVLTYSAFVAEVLRSGILSVHPSQSAAARSLGLNNRQALRYVVLPQAVRRQVPPLLNDLVSLQKDTGLVSIGGAVDAVRAADIIVGRSLNYTPYIVAGLVFVALTIPMTRFTDWVTARMDRRQAQGGSI